jgi:hypothetical protein
MPLRLFTDKTSWDDSRRDVRYTAAALEATGQHAAMAKPLRALLTQWKTIEAEREDADDAMVDANAVVRHIDAALDREVNHLAGQLLAENGRDTAAPGFRRFFPEAPSAVIRLGLESEIEHTKKFDTVAEEVGASKEVKAILKRVDALRTKGGAALKEREKVAERQGRVSLRIATWKDDANHARRSVESALEKLAAEQRLPRSYSDEFFPPGRTAKRTVEAAPPDQPK